MIFDISRVKVTSLAAAALASISLVSANLNHEVKADVKPEADSAKAQSPEEAARANIASAKKDVETETGNVKKAKGDLDKAQGDAKAPKRMTAANVAVTKQNGVLDTANNAKKLQPKQ